jgi:hypothetical protein
MATIRLRYVNSFRNKQRRDGRSAIFSGGVACAPFHCPACRGSEEFMRGYAEALAATPEQTEIGADRTLPGSIKALVVTYYTSENWLHLARDRRQHVGPSSSGSVFSTAINGWRSWNVVTLKKMLAAISKPSARLQWLKAIRGLLQSAVPLATKRWPRNAVGAEHERAYTNTNNPLAQTDEETRIKWALANEGRIPGRTRTTAHSGMISRARKLNPRPTVAVAA